MSTTPDDFPILFAHLSERNARSLEATLLRIDGYECVGLLLKVELGAVKYDVTNAFDEAWRKVVREPFCHHGNFQKLTDAEHTLEQALFHPYPHVVAGYLKRAEAATKAAGPMRDAMLGLLREIAPLAARVVALKSIVGKRAPKETKTSLAEKEREAKAMTCQCCARKILAETGAIAHHGYERPGMGWQTASCPGARELPFEVDRDWLGLHIEHQRERLAQQRARLAALQAGRPDLILRWTYSDRSGCKRSWERGVDKTVSVTADTFADKFAEAVSLGYSGKLTFEVLREHAIRDEEGAIERTVRYIETQQNRFDGWRQTHRREGDLWVALEVSHA